MFHVLASLGQHEFLEGRDSVSTLTCVLTGIINVPNDWLSWCFAIKEREVGILHSTPDLALMPLHCWHVDILSI